MFKLKRACDDCPFRKSVRFPLRRARVAEIVKGGVAFQCHRTLWGAGCEERGLNGKGAQQCAGIMLMLHRSNQSNAIMRVGAFFGHFDPTKLVDDPDVFANIGECLSAEWWLL